VGILVYDVTIPTAPTFVNYYNDRGTSGTTAVLQLDLSF